MRTEHFIKTIPGGQTFNPSKDYLPFYFAPRSVMLFRITTGFNVPQVNQQDIIHLVVQLKKIVDKADFLFTDGHGYARITNWYDHIDYLKELDWNTISDQNWRNTESDSDKQRRKQAEFWTKYAIPLSEIEGLAVYNQNAKEKVAELCKKYSKDVVIKLKK